VAERFGPDRVYLEKEAEAEYLEASQAYASESQTLADDFEKEVRWGATFIAENPEAAPLVEGTRVRRKVLRRFPYSLFYAIEGERIHIVAVAHGKRRHGYWLDRLGS